MSRASGWVLLAALTVPGAALACSPVPTPISGWRGQVLAPHWQPRPCAPEWAARAGNRRRVACYRVARAGRVSLETLAQDVLGLPPAEVQVQTFSPAHQRLTVPARGERGQQILDVWNRPSRGQFINSFQAPTVREHLNTQLQTLLSSAARLPEPPHPWLRWLLGDGRQDCARFVPLDPRFVQSCTVRPVEAVIEDFSMGQRERRLLPLAEFTLRRGVALGPGLRPGHPYAAYPRAGCAETTLSGVEPGSSPFVWPID